MSSLRAVLRFTAASGVFAVLSAFSGVASAIAADMAIPFTLSKPAGNGPFPAVVILHDCSGLGPKSSGAPWRWSTRLVARGFVTIWPDSFSSRGHRDGICTEGSRRTVGYRERAGDAYAALSHLRSLPYVDGRRVAVMGGSHGGSSTLATIVDTVIGPRQDKDGFAAAIALYPNCAARLGEWSAIRGPANRGPITGYRGVFKPNSPLLILIGALDDWTPAEPCRQLASRAKAAGYAVDIVVYPDAHHSFDNRAPVVFKAARRNLNVPGGRGATTGGNPKAWAAAVDQVEKFLARHLAAETRAYEHVPR